MKTRKPRKENMYEWLYSHAMTEDQLRNLARVARATHSVHKHSRFGCVLNTNAPIGDLWLRVAMRVVECGVSPETYVSAHWAQSKDPFVEFMGSERGKRVVPDIVENVRKNVRIRIEVQSERLARWRNERTDSLHDMLVDPRGQFEPAFVYCIATWCGLPDLVEQVKDDAMLVLSDPTALRVFQEAFPEAFTSR